MAGSVEARVAAARAAMKMEGGAAAGWAAFRWAARAMVDCAAAMD